MSPLFKMFTLSIRFFNVYDANVFTLWNRCKQFVNWLDSCSDYYYRAYRIYLFHYTMNLHGELCCLCAILLCYVFTAGLLCYI